MSTAPGRPEIRFIPVSTDEGRIRFFGTLMPAILLLKTSPTHFVRTLVEARTTPGDEIACYIAANTDDMARVDDAILLVHQWNSPTFDPLAFARAKTVLARFRRMVQREGYQGDPLDPLSPSVNLPKLAARAGLGTLSPFGLLVHPSFGPRLILSGLRTDYPLVSDLQPKGVGCNDCMSCVKVCPQRPLETHEVALRACQSCAQCLVVCPVGKAAYS